MTPRASVDPVRRAVTALASDRMIIVADERKADLVAAAESSRDDSVAFMIRHTTGILNAPMPAECADRLALAALAPDDPATGNATVSVDLIGVDIGASARARAATIRALVDRTTEPHDLRRPGHVFPIRVADGGVLVRAEHAEAAVDLLRMAGLSGVGAAGALVTEPGELCTSGNVSDFAHKHDLPVITIADLVRYRRIIENWTERGATARLPTRFGEFQATAFRDTLEDVEHLVLQIGDVTTAGRSIVGVPVHIHRECVVSDIVGSSSCASAAILRQSMRAIATHGVGVIVYLRGHRTSRLALACDHRDESTPAQDDLDTSAHILRALGVRRIRPVAGHPARWRSFSDDHRLVIVATARYPPPATASSSNPISTPEIRTQSERSRATRSDRPYEPRQSHVRGLFMDG